MQTTHSTGPKIKPHFRAKLLSPLAPQYKPHSYARLRCIKTTIKAPCQLQKMREKQSLHAFYLLLSVNLFYGVPQRHGPKIGFPFF